MEVEYELTPEDVKAFQEYQRGRTPLGASRPLNLGWILVGFMVLIISPWCLNGYSHDAFLTGALVGLAAGVILAGIVVAFVYPITIVTRENQIKQAVEAIGRMQISLTLEGVKQATPAGIQITYWHHMRPIETTRNHLFLYTSPQLAWVVPRRAFPSDDAFDQAVTTARSYQEANKAGRYSSPQVRQPPSSTNIQASDQLGKSGTVEGIVPKGPPPQP